VGGGVPSGAQPSRFEVTAAGARLCRPRASCRPAGEGIIVPLTVTGDDALRNERMTAWELGYRFQPSQRWLIEARCSRTTTSA
jgi:outer membrane receptor protein involved in Fe transport